MHQFSKVFRLVAGVVAVLSVIFMSNLWPAPAKAQSPTIRPIVFPVVGSVSYYDDFGNARSGGRSHEGNDLMGRKMMPLVAAVSGTVRSVVWPQATWGYSVTIEDSEGYTYHYLHMNNDTPGTDNGQAIGPDIYAPDIRRGQRVVAGQLLGWMGDSGNAEGTSAHLHFEIRRNGEAFSPYASLQAATKITAPVDYPKLDDEILPFGNFQGGANIAAGNFDSDSDSEIVAGAGPSGGPHVQVFEQNTNAASVGFFPYEESFRGGVDVAAGDIDGDGRDEIITGPGRGHLPEVKIYTATGQPVRSFMVYDGFRGGVRVAAADLNGDGKAEIITGPQSGGGPHVKVFDALGQMFTQFMAYGGAFNGGIDVAAFKTSGSGTASIVISPNTGGGPHVQVFDLAGQIKAEFMAYDPNHRGGLRVSIGQVQGSSTPQIVTAALLGGPHFKIFDLNGASLDDDFEFEEWWSGSWDVAAGSGTTFVTTGPNTHRRTSIREVDFRSSGSPWDDNNDDNDDFDWGNWWRNRDRNN